MYSLLCDIWYWIPLGLDCFFYKIIAHVYTCCIITVCSVNEIYAHCVLFDYLTGYSHPAKEKVGKHNTPRQKSLFLFCFFGNVSRVWKSLEEPLTKSHSQERKGEHCGQKNWRWRRKNGETSRWDRRQLDAAWVWSLQCTFGGVPSHLSIPPTLHLVDSTWNKLKVFISFLELKMKFTSYLGIEAKTWVQSTIDDSQYFSLGELSSSGCLQNNINK